MPWFPVALAVAFFAAGESALLKKFFGHLGPLELTAASLLYPLPFLFALLPFIPVPEHVPAAFWWTIPILVPLNGAGILCHMSALSLAPLSLVMPLLSFTPAFVILTGWLVLGETLNTPGILGIAAIVVGSYVLNLDARRPGDWLAPLKAPLKERGPRLMLAASALYAFSAVVGKRMVLLTNPVFSGLVFFPILDTACLLGLVLFGRVRLGGVLSRPLAGLACGAVSCAHYLTHLWGISLVQAAYMIAVKRLSGLFSVAFGRLLFGEKKIFLRIAGALCMFCGTLAIAFGG